MGLMPSGGIYQTRGCPTQVVLSSVVQVSLRASRTICGLYELPSKIQGSFVSSLLHIDASSRDEGSTSRQLTSHFATQWRRNHPDVGYVYRDLAAQPIPHLTHPVREYLLDPSRDHGQTDDEKALVDTVVSEVHDADTIVLGVPMYNYKAIGLADNLTFVHAELTLATIVPATAELKPLGEKSLATAPETLKKLAA